MIIGPCASMTSNSGWRQVKLKCRAFHKAIFAVSSWELWMGARDQSHHPMKTLYQWLASRSSSKRNQIPSSRDPTTPSFLCFMSGSSKSERGRLFGDEIWFSCVIIVARVAVLRSPSQTPKEIFLHHAACLDRCTWRLSATIAPKGPHSR